MLGTWRFIGGEPGYFELDCGLIHIRVEQGPAGAWQFRVPEIMTMAQPLPGVRSANDAKATAIHSVKEWIKALNQALDAGLRSTLT